MADMVTLTGTFQDAAGTPMSGSILFALCTEATDGQVIYSPAEIRVTLDNLGAFSVDLEATDDLTTSNMTYRVTERFNGEPPNRYWIELPGTVDPANLADLATFESPPFVALDPTLAASNVGLTAHTIDTTGVHGITDTADLVVTAEVGVNPVVRHSAVGDGSSDDAAALNAAYAAVVADGGGVLDLGRRVYRLDSPLILDGAESVMVRGHGATLRPNGDWAVVFDAGATSTDLTHVLEGVTIDCETLGGSGVKISDHFGAVVRDVKIHHATIGVLVTDVAQWSESTVLDNVVTDWCDVGVQFTTTAGTGSFGYFHWGFVGIYNVPDNGTGLDVGADCYLYHTTIGRLVVQIQGDDAVGIRVDGTIGNNSVWNSVVESSASAFTTRVGLELGAAASVTGIDWHNYFQGSWSPSRIVNTGSIPFELRDGPAYQWRGRALGEGFNLIGFGVFGDSYDRVAIRPDRIMLGPGNAAMDTVIVRHGVGIGGLATGHSWQVDTGAYDSGHLIMGGYHLWVDGSGRLRIKSGEPTSSTDGTVVGTQS